MGSFAFTAETLDTVSLLREKISTIKSLQADWEIIPPSAVDAKTGVPQKVKYSNLYRIWMKGDKIRLEYTLRSNDDGKLKSKQLSVFDDGKLSSLRLPEKALIRKVGTEAGTSIPTFPPFGAFQMFTRDENQKQPGYLITLSSFANNGPIDRGIKTASLRKSKGETPEDYISDPFQSPVPEAKNLKVGYGISINPQGWPHRVSYFVYDDNKPVDAATEHYENVTPLGEYAFPRQVKKPQADITGKPAFLTLKISNIKINEEIDDELFFIDPSSAEFTWDPSEGKVIIDGKSVEVPAK